MSMDYCAVYDYSIVLSPSTQKGKICYLTTAYCGLPISTIDPFFSLLSLHLSLASSF